MGEKRNAFRFLVGKPKGKRPQGRSTRMWMDNIKMDFCRDRKEWWGLNWSVLG
jgi:hypothetical protein